MVQIKKVGYQPVTLIVEIGPADTIPLTLTLKRLAPMSAGAAQTLPTVVTRDSAPAYISPGLQSFEERRRSGFGHFMTEAELRKQDNRKLTNVIRELPGVTMTIQGGDCEINIYIDGVAVSDNDLEKLSVNEFAALELFRRGDDSRSIHPNGSLVRRNSPLDS
jgi:hypothetical protein